VSLDSRGEPNESTDAREKPIEVLAQRERPGIMTA
jgi:hypothetical protein